MKDFKYKLGDLITIMSPFLLLTQYAVVFEWFSIFLIFMYSAGIFGALNKKIVYDAIKNKTKSEWVYSFAADLTMLTVWGYFGYFAAPVLLLIMMVISFNEWTVIQKEGEEYLI